MSVSNGFFTNDDGEMIKLSAVAVVMQMQGVNGWQVYEVVLIDGSHISVKNSYYARNDFITAYQAT